MRVLKLTPDTLRRPHAEACMALSVMYRIWQGLVIALSNGRTDVTLAMNLTGSSGVLESAEYVARAEMESLLSEVVHGVPSGMGPHQLAFIESLSVALGQAVWDELQVRYAAIVGGAQAQTVLGNREVVDGMAAPFPVTDSGVRDAPLATAPTLPPTELAPHEIAGDTHAGTPGGTVP